MVQQATTLIQQGEEYWLEPSIGEMANKKREIFLTFHDCLP